MKFIAFVFGLLCRAEGCKGHHFKINLQGVLSIFEEQEEAGLGRVFIRHRPPICQSWVEEDLRLILQPICRGFRMLTRKLDKMRFI